jgi:hypothetical protein
VRFLQTLYFLTFSFQYDRLDSKILMIIFTETCTEIFFFLQPNALMKFKKPSGRIFVPDWRTGRNIPPRAGNTASAVHSEQKKVGGKQTSATV